MTLRVHSLLVSFVDQQPCELLLLGIKDLTVETSSGLGQRFSVCLEWRVFCAVGPRGQHSQLRVNVKDAQLDDQLLGSSFPVLAKRWNKFKGKLNHDKLFSFSVVSEAGLHHGRLRCK